MENTGKVLFENDQAVWFLAMGDQTVGPLQAADVYEKMLLKQVTSAHYVWKKGLKAWQRISETAPFTEMLPSAPKNEPSIQIQLQDPPVYKETLRPVPPAMVSAPVPEQRIWFLYFNDSQFGPFSVDEVRSYLKLGKINSRVHTWKEGMKEWVRLEELADFNEAVETSKKIFGELPVENQPKEKRGSPRLPLVAKVFVANSNEVMSAICRDISIGGMQVLTDHVPGQMGTQVKLNVTPPNDGQGVFVEPFVAEGVIVRLLEDGRGFSFRFENLGNDAKKAIENYIKGTG